MHPGRFFLLVPLLACALLTFLRETSAAATLPGSPEFRVNVTTAGMQRSPALAIDDAGNSMVVWGGEQGGPPGPISVYGRIYDPQGNPRTGEFLVAAPKTDFIFTSKVAANRSGEFLVVWDEGGRLYARRFGGDGQPLGPEVRLNTATSTAGPPAIARRPQGGFLVVWADVHGVRGLFLDERGSPQGSEIELAPAASQLGEPRVSVSPAGNFVVTWSAGSDFFEVDIWARRFGADGDPQGNAILVNGVAPYQAGYQTGAIPVALPDGSFTVVWETGLEIRSGRLGVFSRSFAAGQPPADIVELNPPGNLPHLSTPALAIDRLGRLLLLWNGDGPDDDDGLFGRLLDSAGRPAGETFLANVFREQSQTEPAVVANGTGEFVAVWASGTDYPAILPVGNPGLLSQDGSFFGVFGRRFSAACSLDGVTLCLGDRFQVQVSWTAHDGNTGVGRAIPLTSDTGAFWFFNQNNLELMIKVLDGGAVNGHFWVFYGALSDVSYTLTVTDTATGATRTYTNPPGQLASRADTEAFPRD